MCKIVVLPILSGDKFGLSYRRYTNLKSMDIILIKQRKEKATALEMMKQTSVKKAVVRRLSCHCLSPSRSPSYHAPRAFFFFLSLPSLPPKWLSETLEEECVRLR